MRSKSILLNCFLLFSCLILIGCCKASFLDKLNAKKGVINIELKRQKSPLEQHINNEAYLSHRTDLVFKKGNRTNDSIALYRYLDNEFYGDVVIGHPGQTLRVAFDTAWTNSWVLSSMCNIWKNIGCWFHNVYDHTRSSEWKKDGRPYVATEGRYNYTGFYSYDNFSIAHSNVTAMNFVEMTNVPYTFAFNKIDGVLGLGLATADHQPFFYKLLREKKIANPIFSIYLNRDKQSKRGGNIILGFIDDKHVHKTIINGNPVSDKINYYSLEPSNYWKFQVNTIVVNMSDPVILCKKGCKAIVDTSTNSITGPVDEIKEINDRIKAKEFLFNRFTVDCDTINKLPVIYFEIGSMNYTLKGPNYTVQLSWKGLQICLSAFVAAETDFEENMWVLGGTFLSEYYTVYDVYNKRIGIVKAAT